MKLGNFWVVGGGACAGRPLGSANGGYLSGPGGCQLQAVTRLVQ